METASGKSGFREPLSTTKERPWLRVGSSSWKGIPRRVLEPWGRLLKPSFLSASGTPEASPSKDSPGPMLAALDRSRYLVCARAEVEKMDRKKTKSTAGFTAKPR